jgi:hypothetical protein
MHTDLTNNTEYISAFPLLISNYSCYKYFSHLIELYKQYTKSLNQVFIPDTEERKRN